MAEMVAERLYFLRHGLADRSGWHGDDFARPLTPEGRERLGRTASLLARLDLGVDVILSSPLTRAKETAEIVAEGLGLSDKMCEDERLACGFGPRLLVEILRDQPSIRRPLLVGHEPDFSHTISSITGGSGIVCKKGSLARIDLVAADPLAGNLVWLLPPKLLALQP